MLFKLVKDDENDNDDFLIINNSPIDYGHVLIVPKLNSKLNQVF